MFIKKENMVFSLDDFGISRKANENILKIAEARKADRVSVMVNGMVEKDDVARLLSSGVKLDLHLNANDGTDSGDRTKKGVVKRLMIFFGNYFSGRQSTIFVEKHWEEEIIKFQEIFKKNPDGINSHEHVHFFPPYFKILLNLSGKYNIKYIRFGKESSGFKNFISLILYFLRKINKKRFAKHSFVTSDLLVSFDWIKSFSLIENYPTNKKNEVVFHPERDEEMNFLENI